MQNFFNPYFKTTRSKFLPDKLSSITLNRSLLSYGLLLGGILLLLLLPAIFSAFISRRPISLFFSLKEILLGAFLFLIPTVLFYKNIKVYLYLLVPLILLSPLFIFSIVLYDIRPRFELIALVMQTNLSEAKEAISGYLAIFLPFTLAYGLLYLYLVRKVPIKRIPFKAALSISLLALLFSFGRIYFEEKLYTQPISEIKAEKLLAVRYYPVSLVGGVLEAYSFADGEMNVPENFSFHAFAKDSLPQRKIFVLIIGESSRYDRWQINGYERKTSPRLLRQKNLISYPNVVSGSNQTRMSVPQMITRATPDSIHLLFQEKSILAAFSETGYKTAWLSNQTDQEMFYSGPINWHAKKADVSMFSPSHSPNFEFDSPYDERLLPVLDSLIHSNKENLFIVLHTMGNHWNYAKRYPKSFDTFKPSGTTVSISRPSAETREAVINSYDNSILYADYVIDSVIKIIDKEKAVSSVAFLSDHGEDLFDYDHSIIDYHLSETPITLHVPLFIWTSDLYRQVYPEKQQALQENLNKKVGTENTFYTLLDLANIGILKEDSTKSLASPSFKDSDQKYVGGKVRKGFLYSDLLKK
jgi:glucan phosphoethanolaminetransferase (alkaline phosphatase superfamily)